MFQTAGVEPADRRRALVECLAAERVAMKGVVRVAESLHDGRTVDIAAEFRPLCDRRTGEVRGFFVQREELRAPLNVFCGALGDRKDAVAVVAVERVEKSDLFLIVPAGGFQCGHPRRVQGRQKKAGQNGDDRDRDEKFNQGEGYWSFHCLLSPFRGYQSP